MTGSVRTLVIAAEHPWPINSGSRRRLSDTLSALGRLGPVELFSIVSNRRTDFAPAPEGSAVQRMARTAIEDRPSIAGWLRSAFRPYMPFEIPSQHTKSVVRSLGEFASGRYDLVWCFRVRAWVLAGEPSKAPAVVDLDDLEDQKIRARLASVRTRETGPVERARRYAGKVLWTADARRWSRLHARIASRSAATVVCSELDAARAALSNVTVVPNGYEAPRRPVGPHPMSANPTVVFHGTLRYPPNADAARFLVEEVGPRLRERLAGVELRLVGLATPALESLADPPRVVVTGQVSDITTELARADVVVVPLRFASGTRVKILEAFAHRIPVVSTTVGAEGLEAQGGVHLLIADDPESIARACAVVVSDPKLRERLIDAAQDLYLTRYQSSAMQDAVAELARKVTGR